MDIPDARCFAFVGVTTRSSAVVGVFDTWCQILGVDWTLVHWDLPVDAPASEYEEIVQAFRAPNIAGGLVTTHKANLFSNEWRSFDLLEPLSMVLGEIGVVSKREGALCGGVSDVESGGAILETLVQSEAWLQGDRHAYILGAGGSGLAAMWNLGRRGIGGSQRITVVDPDPARREVAARLASEPHFLGDVRVLSGCNGVADDCVDCSEHGSLIINASGLGKDREGSPVSSGFVFPSGAIAWDFNYRGELGFLNLARGQAAERGLTVYDGFDYFACGWSVVASRVAGSPWNQQLFRSFLRVAAEVR